MDYSDKTESRRQAKDALHALREAERYLEGITKFTAEVQITRAEFDAAVAELRAIRKESLGWRALVLAYLQDQCVPISVFKPWASSAMIWKWRRAKTNPLPSTMLNGRVCIEPRDFFAALHTHGRAGQ